VLHGSPEMPRDVAMATNFGTIIAITGFVRMTATGQLVMEGGLEWRTRLVERANSVSPGKRPPKRR